MLSYREAGVKQCNRRAAANVQHGTRLSYSEQRWEEVTALAAHAQLAGQI